MGKIWVLLESTRLHFMKCSADDLLLHGKSSACGFTRRGANVTAYCCWKERIFVPLSDPHFCLFSHSSAELTTLAWALVFTGHSSVILPYRTSQKLCFCWRNVAASNFSSIRGELLDQWWLWSGSSGLCITPRPQADCRGCAASGRITQEPPARKWKTTDGLWCHSGLSWNVKQWKVEEKKLLAAFLNADWPCLWGKKG